MQRAARRAGRRLRLRSALDALVRWSPLPGVVGVVGLAIVKLTEPSAEPSAGQVQAWGALGAVACLVTLERAFAAWRRTARNEEGALALDRHHGLDDRLTVALSFARRLDHPEARVAPFERSLMELAIEDAVERAPRLDPAGAVPVGLPRRWFVPVLFAAALVGLARFEFAAPPPPIAEAPAPEIDAVALFDDDVALLRQVAEELERQSETPEALAQVREFNRLVEDVAERRLDRREAFARLEALEREIRGSARELEELEEALREMGRELEKAPLSRPAGQALSEQRLADAEQALRQLAERLRRKDDPPSKAELEQLRKSLERASETSRSRREAGDPSSAEQSALEAERQRLLKKKADGTATPQDLEALARTERQLERLGRRKPGENAKGANEPLSELDRKLAEAARELAEAQGNASEFLDQSAESVGRMKQKQLSQKEKEELLERMREMRDMLRQQKGGEQQKEWAERMRRMQRRAQGAPQGGEGDGKPGAGRPGARQPAGVRLGADGQPIPMAGSGKGQGKPGEGKADDGQPGGKGAEPGSGHDPNLAGDPSKTGGKTQDVMAVAPDTGEGTASSEVIYSAAERGFTSGEYSRIFTDYKTVAEDVIEREGIPPGYRSHVRRYFQLIRPRE